jgi:hypothetical protein
MTGIQYTDANAVLPTKAILAVASLMCAAMFLSVIWTRSWRLPVVGTVLLLVVSVVVGGIFPALIQSLKVKPSEKSLEAPYIARNIEATRAAYGLGAIEVTTYVPSDEASAENLRATAAAIPGSGSSTPTSCSPTVRSCTPCATTTLPRCPRRRPLHDRRESVATSSSRLASSTSPVCLRAAQLAQRPHGLHARLRRRRGIWQPAGLRRGTGLRRGLDPGRHRRPGGVRAADLLRGAVPDYSIVGAPRARRRGSSTTRPRSSPSRSTTRMPARAASRWTTRSSWPTA